MMKLTFLFLAAVVALSGCATAIMVVDCKPAFQTLDGKLVSKCYKYP